MAFLEREPELVPLFVQFWSYAGRNPELRPRFAEQRARARAIVCGVIEQAARDPGLRFRVPPDQLATAVEARRYGLALQRLAEGVGARRPVRRGAGSSLRRRDQSRSHARSG